MTQETERSQVKANLIKSNLEKLKNDIKKDDNEIEKAYEIVDVGEKNFDFNEQSQEGQGLKILAPQQMLIRLPISLAQLKAGSNSEKF